MKRTRWFIIGAVVGIWGWRWFTEQMRQAPRRAAGIASKQGTLAARRAGEAAGNWFAQFKEGFSTSAATTDKPTPIRRSVGD